MMIFETLTIWYMLTVKLAQSDGPYAGLFTYDEYVAIQNKRIRREIRDLSDEEWDAVANAMNIMKNTPTAEGRALYGDTYFSYDDLVCQHARGTYHTGGDLSHSGPQFNIWHRAFILSFENILVSIDPSIEGAPYWDFRIDINEQGSSYDMTDSIIFSDKYFGEYSTVNDPNKDYAVKTGKFGYWPINDDPDILAFGCESIRNAFGFLRKQTNVEDTPYFTRFGGYQCGNIQAIGRINKYDECLNNETLTDYTAFWRCYDGAVHGAAHNGVGGTRFAFDGQEQSNGCRAFAGAAIWEGNIRQFAIHHGCFDCPPPGSCVYGIDEAFECGMCKYSDLVELDSRGNYQCYAEDATFRMNGVREELQVIGDFVDQVTSPNDPIFFFHHVNVDRYLTEWQLKHYEQSPYYNYPESGWGYTVGCNFNDVITPEAPFTNLFNDPEAAPYTFKQILEGTSIVNAAYTYDTILEMIEQSEPIPPLANTPSGTNDSQSTNSSDSADSSASSLALDKGSISAMLDIILVIFGVILLVIIWVIIFWKCKNKGHGLLGNQPEYKSFDKKSTAESVPMTKL